MEEHLQFSPNLSDYQKSPFDFEDQTIFAIKGWVKYRNLDYFIENVDILIDEGSVTKTTTDDEGHFLKTLQIGEHTLTPSYYDHTFMPKDTAIFVTSADSNIIFEDTTTYVLSGKVGGGQGGTPHGRFCTNCGGHVQPNWKACPNCGNML